MANRMIKDSIRVSKSVNSLTDFQFRFWLYLITFVDDFGRGTADPELLKGLCFPRRKGITEDQITDTLGILASKGMISLYEVEGEPYFYFPKWSDHQRIQTKVSKYPEPPKEPVIPVTTPSPTVSHGESPSPTVSQRLETETETNKNYKENINTRARTRESSPTNDAFEIFWDTYPKKTGDIRLTYQEYLFAIEETKPEVLLEALKKQVEAADEDDLKYFHSADKWLRNREWKKPVTRSKKKNERRPFEPTQFDDQGGLK